MQIFVISLRSASERRRSVSDQFREAGLPFRFFDAIEGRKGLELYADAIDRPTYRLNTYREPVPGEIGCYASHLALWRPLLMRFPRPVLHDRGQHNNYGTGGQVHATHLGARCADLCAGSGKRVSKGLHG